VRCNLHGYYRPCKLQVRAASSMAEHPPFKRRVSGFESRAAHMGDMTEEQAMELARNAIKLAARNYRTLVECVQLLLVKGAEDVKPDEVLVATTVRFIMQVMTENETMEALAVVALRDARSTLGNLQVAETSDHEASP
jgi:hypothetical protein